MDTDQKASNIGLLFLRIGIGIVFILFGFDKLSHPTHWIIFIPNWLSQTFAENSHISLYMFIWIQGLVEGVLGIHLLCGFFARWAAAVSTIILALIVYTLGYDPVAIRDVGLLCTSLAICFVGGGKWSIDYWLHDSKADKRPLSQIENSMTERMP